MAGVVLGTGLLGLALVVALPVVVPPLRPAYLVVFCLVVPGPGWAYRVGTGDAGDRIALALAISISATIVVATAMVATTTWSLPLGVGVLAAFGALGFVPYGGLAGLTRRGRRGARVRRRPPQRG